MEEEAGMRFPRGLSTASSHPISTASCSCHPLTDASPSPVQRSACKYFPQLRRMTSHLCSPIMQYRWYASCCLISVVRVPNVRNCHYNITHRNCHYNITHLSDEACLCPPYTQLRRCPLPDPLPVLPQGWSDTHLSHTQHTPHLSHMQYTPVSHTYNIPACIHLIQNYTVL